ncbi:MAG: hypothetical protein J6P72_06475 [Firmicutes bacterium]|nr:hypothetical protein [Bacillota bacterium]
MPKNNKNLHEVALDFSLRGMQLEIFRRFLIEIENQYNRIKDKDKEADKAKDLKHLLGAGQAFYDHIVDIRKDLSEFKNEELHQKSSVIATSFGNTFESALERCRAKGYVGEQQTGKYAGRFLKNWDESSFEMGHTFAESRGRDLDKEEEEDEYTDDMATDVPKLIDPSVYQEYQETDISELEDDYEGAEAEEFEPELTDEQKTVGSPYHEYIEKQLKAIKEPDISHNAIKQRVVAILYAKRQEELYKRNPARHGLQPENSLWPETIRFYTKNEKTIENMFNTRYPSVFVDMKPDDMVEEFRNSRIEVKYGFSGKKQEAFRSAATETLKQLKATGKGTYGGFIPRFRNHQRYENALSAIETATKPNAEPEDVYQSVLRVKAYLQDKQTVRNRGFGNQRVALMLNYLSVAMQKADFKKYCDQLNEARGVSQDPLDEDYVSPEDFKKDTSVRSYMEEITKNLEGKKGTYRDVARMCVLYQQSPLIETPRGFEPDPNGEHDARSIRQATDLMMQDENFKQIMRNVPYEKLLEDIKTGGHKYLENIQQGAETAQAEKQAEKNAGGIGLH